MHSWNGDQYSLFQHWLFNVERTQAIFTAFQINLGRTNDVEVTCAKTCIDLNIIWVRSSRPRPRQTSVGYSVKRHITTLRESSALPHPRWRTMALLLAPLTPTYLPFKPPTQMQTVTPSQPLHVPLPGPIIDPSLLSPQDQTMDGRLHALERDIQELKAQKRSNSRTGEGSSKRRKKVPDPSPYILINATELSKKQMEVRNQLRFVWSEQNKMSRRADNSPFRMRMSNLPMKTLPNLPKRRPKLKKNLKRRKRPKTGEGEVRGRSQRAPRNTLERASRMKAVPEYKEKHKREPVFVLETDWTSDELSSLETDDEEKKTVHRRRLVQAARLCSDQQDHPVWERIRPRFQSTEGIGMPSFTALPFNSSGDEGLTAFGDCGAALSVEGSVDLPTQLPCRLHPACFNVDHLNLEYALQFETLNGAKRPISALPSRRTKLGCNLRISNDVQSQPFECLSTGQPRERLIPPHHQCKPVVGVATTVRSFQDSDRFPLMLYIRPVPHLKPLGSAITSVFVSTFATLSVLWRIFSVVTEALAASEFTCEGSDFDGVSDYEANLFVSAGEHKAPLHDAGRQNSKIRMSIAIKELQVSLSLVRPCGSTVLWRMWRS
ncbi:hypothetical protein DFH09DRAFT_1097223 [Mycena vulgaris]|nr:hypothetical protein DFH09DRAFT_1097223 [Mycena vulgaris]